MNMRRRLDWLCRNDAAAANAGGARERLLRQAQRLLRLTPDQKNDGSSRAARNSRANANGIFSLAAADAASLGKLLAFAWPEHA